MAEELKVLLIEDAEDDALLILRALRKGGYEPRHQRVDSEAALRQALNEESWDLVLSDYAMPGFDGLKAVEIVHYLQPELPFILVSGAVGEEAATEVMRRGARDYIMKEKLTRLVPAVQRELAESRERKRRRKIEESLQAQLNQAQKMEAIGTLAGGVAHDFNNLLTVIKGYAEIALLEIKPDQPGHAELQGITQAAQRSAELTRQLLAFARKQAVKPQQLDLNQAVEDMLKMLQRLIGEDIELSWQPGADLWPVRIDPGQVDQILANLCVNARDAVDDQGRIGIATANMVLDEDYCAPHADITPGEYVQLSVSDNGSGMDAATRKRIFEPFFTTKAVGQGSGLGLATVYGIVKQNEGFINFYSEPSQGSIFRIYLPRRDQEGAIPAPEASPETSGTPGNGETILLVEDEETILEVTSKILEGLGYQVLAAPTPHRALEMARQQAGEIDLLLSDVVMPELNGQELAHKVREIQPDLRCLFMSGYTADVISHNGLLGDGVNFLQKPFSLHDLAAKVNATLAQ
ncbi:MAG: response regulator [Desulfurivibrio sp.]|nr:response regulator [Desulfurivibrio sp.]